jgi:hypothetical protein
MNSLQATGDIRKVALWLGHSSLKSTEIYLRADPTEKLNAIEKALPPGCGSSATANLLTPRGHSPSSSAHERLRFRLLD